MTFWRGLDPRRIVALLTLAAVGVSSCTSQTPTDPGTNSQTDPAAPSPDPTPLSVDEDLRIGILDNGLTYYLRHNEAPGGTIHARLVVNAGSAEQDDPDSGTAHFLEHMLFNGTKAFPGNELDRVLQGLGIAFGPDVNAYTSYDETVYLLTANTSQNEAVETTFDVLAEWAMNTTLEATAVVEERGVVQDERRQSRESVDGQIYTEFEDIYTAGTEYEGYGVIGSSADIDATEAAALRIYYDRWYRPDNMAVIVVGDMTLDDMEALVVDRFQAMTARGNDHPPPTARATFPSPENLGFHVTHPDNLVDNLSVDWQLPVWDLGTVGGAQLAIWEELITLLITTRLQSAYFAGELDADAQPNFATFNINRNLRFVGTNIRTPDLAKGFRSHLGVIRGVTENGFTPAELADARATIESSLDAWEGTFATVTDEQFADQYTSFFLTGAGGESLGDTVERERAVLAAVTPEQLTAHWTWIMNSSGALAAAVGAAGNTLPQPDELVEIANTAAAKKPTTVESAINQLMNPPDPITPRDRTSRVNEFDASIVTLEFDNGTTVVFQPSDISAGVIDLYAESLGGYTTLPDGSGRLVNSATMAVASSGVGDVSALDLNLFLAKSAVGLYPFIGPETEGFSGSSSTEDVEVMFQLLHLLVTEPRVDPTAATAAVADAQIMAQAGEIESDTLSGLALTRLIYGDDSHSWIPTAEQIEAMTADSLLDLYTTRLGRVDDLIVTISGDIDSATIEDLAARYIATLPAGPSDTFVDTLPSPSTEIKAVQIPLNDGTDNGAITMLWSSERAWSADDAATGKVLESILTTRIFETVREKLGATYGGQAIISTSDRPDSRLEAVVIINGDPSRIDEIRTSVLDELADIIDNGPTADELNRALAVINDDYQFIDNFDFIYDNLNAIRSPETGYLNIANRDIHLARVTKRDVQDLTIGLFDLDAYLETTRR